MHWHGMHLPAAMDGGPHQPIAPGATWSPTWTIDQPAATLWYHPHPHGETERTSTAGSPGMFIVDDAGRVRAGLPATYGVDDIPVIVQDKRFDCDGQFDEARLLGAVGMLGDTMLVNGTRRAVPPGDHRAGPAAAAQRLERPDLRLRLRRRPRTFALIGTDGGLLAAPVPDRPASSSRPASGPRSWSAMRPGERAGAAHLPARPGLDRESPVRRRRRHLRRAGTAGGGAPDSSTPQVPARLVPIDRAWTPATRSRTRTFRWPGAASTASRWTWTASTSRSPGTPPRSGRSPTWTSTPHSFHVHDVQFQVLDRGRRAAAAGAGRLEGHRLPARRTADPADRCGSPTTPTRRRRTCTTATCSCTRTRA